MSLDSLQQEIDGLNDQRSGLEAKLEAVKTDIQALWNELEEYLCESCAGMGWIDVGDCEDGVIRTCPHCVGKGFINE